MYKCDVCSKEIDKAEMQVVSGASVVTMTSAGFVPTQVDVGLLAAFSPQNDTSKAEIWATSVSMNPTADWGFCQSCFSEFKAYEQKQQQSRCFIATSACGVNSEEVITLRHFRDTILLNYVLGRLLVKTYYKISPPIASFIKRSAKTQFIIRNVFVRPLAKLVNRKNP